MTRLPPRPGERLNRSETLSFTFDGRPVAALGGDTIGSALYAAGQRTFSRSFKYHRRRGLMCCAGNCPNCLVAVDGAPGVRACTEPVREGMRVEHLNAKPGLELDAMAVTDVLGGPFTPPGFYYKTFIRPRRLWPLYEWVLRHAAGLGRLPQRQAERGWRTEYRRRHTDVLVVGGGHAGLGAAIAAAELGADVVLVDDGPEPGGRLLWEGGHEQARALSRARARGGRRDHQLGARRSATSTASFPFGRATRCTRCARAARVCHRRDRAAARVRRQRPARRDALGGRPTARGALRRAPGHAGGRREHLRSRAARRERAARARRRGARRGGSQARAVAGGRAAARAGHRDAAAAGRSSGQGTARRAGRRARAARRARRSAHAAPRRRGPARARLRPAARVRRRGTRHVAGRAGGRRAPSTTPRAVTSRSPSCRRESGRPARSRARARIMRRRPRASAPDWPPPHALGLGDARSAARSERARRADRTDAARRRRRPRRCPRPTPRSKGKAFTCFCEDVTAKDIHRGVQEGYDSIELCKRFTTVTMGPCQGRMCQLSSIRLMSSETGQGLEQIGTTTARPPWSTVPLGALAGRPIEPAKRSSIHGRHRELGASDQMGGRLAPRLRLRRSRGRGAERPRGRRTDRRLDARQAARARTAGGRVPRPPVPQPALQPEARARALRRAHLRRRPDHGRRHDQPHRRGHAST